MHAKKTSRSRLNLEFRLRVSLLGSSGFGDVKARVGWSALGRRLIQWWRRGVVAAVLVY